MAAMCKSSTILVHGIFDRGTIFNKMARHLEAQGIEPHAPDFTPNNGNADLRTLSVDLGNLVEKIKSENKPLFLVGFSMGGLICRYYMQRLGGAEWVDRWVTISTPHHGTLTAHGSRGKGARQMRPGSQFLNDLNEDITQIEKIPFLSIWTPFDLMIVPASSSILPVGNHQKIAVLAHPMMHSSERVIKRVIQFLQAAS